MKKYKRKSLEDSQQNLNAKVVKSCVKITRLSQQQQHQHLQQQQQQQQLVLNTSQLSKEDNAERRVILQIVTKS